MSHPAWVCGLKLFLIVNTVHFFWSHPAWVCGLKLFLIVNTVHFFWSHPAWVCGLKHDCTYSLLQISSSHPAWVCGLKLPPFSHLALRLCHTLRGCVDWNNAIPEYSNLWHVTPCVGVWIETWMNYQRGGETQVTPCVGVWIETLLEWYTTTSKKVTPCVGVWIETRRHSLHWRLSWVTPCVGVWIETGNDRQLCGRIVSHPAWVCGLKLSSVYSCIYIYCHTLRGCVDWNFAYLQGYRREGSHTLRGCVDWNTQSTTIIARMNCHTLRGCIWIEALFTRWSSLWKNCKHSASCVFLFKLL